MAFGMFSTSSAFHLESKPYQGTMENLEEGAAEGAAEVVVDVAHREGAVSAVVVSKVAAVVVQVVVAVAAEAPVEVVEEAEEVAVVEAPEAGPMSSSSRTDTLGSSLPKVRITFW